MLLSWRALFNHFVRFHAFQSTCELGIQPLIHGPDHGLTVPFYVDPRRIFRLVFQILALHFSQICQFESFLAEHPLETITYVITELAIKCKWSTSRKGALYSWEGWERPYYLRLRLRYKLRFRHGIYATSIAIALGTNPDNESTTYAVKPWWNGAWELRKLSCKLWQFSLDNSHQLVLILIIQLHHHSASTPENNSNFHPLLHTYELTFSLQQWYNHYLKWNKSEYGNITSINVKSSNVWLPDMVLYNK
jgi:hypothetical protein